MELKQAANTEPRRRFHFLRKLSRARKHATNLSKLCEECPRCDARTRLEAQVSEVTAGWVGVRINCRRFIYCYMCGWKGGGVGGEGGDLA